MLAIGLQLITAFHCPGRLLLCCEVKFGIREDTSYLLEEC